MKQGLINVIEQLNALREDSTIPRNIKRKIENVVCILEQDDELSMRVNKVLNVLDEISNDNNIPPYTRTQIWNVVSRLEAI